jgi:hypothetical protein
MDRSTELKANQRNRGLRTRGFDHALAGKEKASDERAYLQGYRRGLLRRKLLLGGGKEEG